MRRVVWFAYGVQALRRDRLERVRAGARFDPAEDDLRRRVLLAGLVSEGLLAESDWTLEGKSLGDRGEALGQLLPNVYQVVLARIKDRPAAGSMTAIAAGAS